MHQVVQKILEGKNCQEQDAHRQFRTYFLVDSNFCNPAAGDEKGSVENLVGFAQRNIVGPRIEARSWPELEPLWQNCRSYDQRRLRGESLTVYERWQREPPLRWTRSRTGPNLLNRNGDSFRFRESLRRANS